MSTLQILVERWFAAGWILFGLSHLLWPSRWVALYTPVVRQAAGAFIIGIPTLLLGLFVILAHNVWVSGPALAVTLAGWLLTLKGSIYLLYPRALAQIVPREARFRLAFRIGGAVGICLGVWLGSEVFRAK